MSKPDSEPPSLRGSGEKMGDRIKPKLPQAPLSSLRSTLRSLEPVEGVELCGHTTTTTNLVVASEGYNAPKEPQPFPSISYAPPREPMSTAHNIITTPDQGKAKCHRRSKWPYCHRGLQNMSEKEADVASALMATLRSSRPRRRADLDLHSGKITTKFSTRGPEMSADDEIAFRERLRQPVPVTSIRYREKESRAVCDAAAGAMFEYQHRHQHHGPPRPSYAEAAAAACNPDPEKQAARQLELENEEDVRDDDVQWVMRRAQKQETDCDTAENLDKSFHCISGRDFFDDLNDSDDNVKDPDFQDDISSLNVPADGYVLITMPRYSSSRGSGSSQNDRKISTEKQGRYMCRTE